MASYKLYFAYGSNLNQTRMKKRCPGSFVWARGRIEGYNIVFGGHSRTWGGAVANIIPWRGNFVDGVIYKVTKDDVKRLDKAEGHPRAYKRVTMPALSYMNDEIWNVDVITYIKDSPDFTLGPPAPDYLRIIHNAYAMLDFSTNRLGLGIHHSDREAGSRPFSRRRRR